MIRACRPVARRCRASEETRRFHRDFPGLELAATKPTTDTETGRGTSVLHSSCRVGDGGFLALFEAPDSPFDLKPKHDFDLHAALEVDEPTLERVAARGQAEGIGTRGPADRGAIRSIHLRGPDGYVVEPAAKTASHDAGWTRGRTAPAPRSTAGKPEGGGAPPFEAPGTGGSEPPGPRAAGRSRSRGGRPWTTPRVVGAVGSAKACGRLPRSAPSVAGLFFGPGRPHPAPARDQAAQAHDRR